MKLFKPKLIKLIVVVAVVLTAAFIPVTLFLAFALKENAFMIYLILAGILLISYLAFTMLIIGAASIIYDKNKIY